MCQCTAAGGQWSSIQHVPGNAVENRCIARCGLRSCRAHLREPGLLSSTGTNSPVATALSVQGEPRSSGIGWAVRHRRRAAALVRRARHVPRVATTDLADDPPRRDAGSVRWGRCSCRHALPGCHCQRKRCDDSACRPRSSPRARGDVSTPLLPGTCALGPGCARCVPAGAGKRQGLR
jgi:hypothetical protein